MSRLLKIIIPGLSIILILIGINNINKEEVVFGDELKANSNLEVIQEQLTHGIKQQIQIQV